MRIAIFGKAVSPNDAEALREAFQRVLQLDASPWISQAYLSELNDHMAVPDAFRAFDGEVPEGTELLLAFGGTAQCSKRPPSCGKARCPSWASTQADSGS